ncbi:MAG TPA: phosphate ABC transporter substrate-binding protein PstS [Rhizomicrobium sp.]|jgi:phosphate transport system substrate-binding protein|nr:phosphate ABC transporter substrate-binding protein PstS [Rhizomicrobium sp.]
MFRELTVALAISAALIVTPAAADSLNGAGGTAIYPVLQVWAQKYQAKTGTAVNYQAIGSGGGIKAIESKTVDFANSDKPLKPEDLDKNGLVQFPQVIISIVPVVNLPGIKPGELVVDGKTLADIFLGKITKWNDPALKALNPRVDLPDMAITTVHRADGSGTTFNFTDYLSKMSPEWKDKVGSDTSVSWPSGLSGKGNAGVAGQVQQVSGTIGYVEFAYAMQSNMTYMDMTNSEGKRVMPTMGAFQSAAANADFSKVQDFYLILTNQPGAKSWPITAATYMLMRKDYPASKNHEVLQFLDWALRDGQADSRKLDYVPFPDGVVKQIERSWTASFGPGAWK